MPYDVSVIRPESDAPVAKSTNWMQWYAWAKKNQPSASITTEKWAGYLVQLPADYAPHREVMMDGGELRAQIVRALVKIDQLPDDVVAVLEFAAEHDYPVRFSFTGESVSQYLAKLAS